MQFLRAAGWETTGRRGGWRDGRGQEFAALLFFFFKECCVAHMSVCPAARTLDGVEGEGTGGKSALPFSSPSTLAALCRALPRPLPYALRCRALRLMPFYSHRIEITPRPFRARWRGMALKTCNIFLAEVRGVHVQIDGKYYTSCNVRTLTIPPSSIHAPSSV